MKLILKHLSFVKLLSTSRHKGFFKKSGSIYFGRFFQLSFIIKKCLKVRQKLGTRENLKKIENLKKFENLKFKIAQVDPRDMLNNFCFHV